MKFSPWQNPFAARECPVRAQPYNQPRTSPDNPVRWTEGTDRSNRILCAPVVASLFFFTFLYQFAIFFTHFQVAGADPVGGGGGGGDGDGAAR